jgi:hypothetical protein
MAGIGDYVAKSKGNRGFKLEGHTLPGPNQRSKQGAPMKVSPTKHTDTVDEGSNRNKDHADAHNKRHADGATHKDGKWSDQKDDKKKQKD